MYVDIKGGLISYTYDETNNILKAYPEIGSIVNKYGICSDSKCFSLCVRMIFDYSKYRWLVDRLIEFGAQIDFHLPSLSDVDVYILKSKLYELQMTNCQPLTTSSGTYLLQYNDIIRQCLNYKQTQDIKLKKFLLDLCHDWANYVTCNVKQISINSNWVLLPKHE